MKALIDAHMLGNHETGNETYIAGLLQGLAELGSRQAVALHDARACPPGHETHVLPGRGNTARLLRELPALARETQASLIHCTYVAPPFSPVPTVVTVHDLSFLRWPEAFTWRDRALLSTAVPYCARRAAALIVPSAHARDEMVGLLGVPEQRIHVTPEGCAPRFAPAPAELCHEALRRYGIDGPYVLAVGNLQPRKNLDRLLSAWRLLRDSAGLSGCTLVLAGGYHGRRAPVARLVERPRLEPRGAPRRLRARGASAGALLRRHGVRAPVPVRRLRPAGAGGHGLRRARGLLAGRLAARGGR